MGACNSVSSIAAVHNHNHGLNHSSATPTATLISTSGDLRRCKLPATAGKALESEPPETFICNSDALIYEEFIPTLNPNEELLPDNLYFVLPNTKLRQRVNVSDMAALAVRASLALQKEECGNLLRRFPITNNNSDRSLRKTKMSECNGSTKTMVGYGSSGSGRKIQRVRSNRVKAAVRSSRRMRLSTIYEGSEP